MSTPRRLPVLLSTLVWALSAGPAQAQYFGRNAVQWRGFSFEVLKTEHFDIHYYPEEKLAAEKVGRMAERWYSRLSRLLGFEFSDRQALILYASHPHFQQTNSLGSQPGESTGGVTEAFKRRIVLPVGASLAETDHVLGHELVHAFQFAMTGQGKVSSSNVPGALSMPLWFIEGMAEYLSVGPIDPHTAMWMRDSARQDKLPTVDKLNSARYFPYRYGQALWAYIGARYGDTAIGELLKAVGPKSTDAPTLFKQVLGVDAATLSKEWHAAIKAAYEPLAAQRQAPSAYGSALVSGKSSGGRMNLGPALSPDGERLVFLSERDLFSIELFLADAKDGAVRRRLSKTAVDPHYESLQFVNSAGAWDPKGTTLALGAVSEGRPVLALIDDQGRKQRDYRFDDLDEIFTPSFSPDGTQVVFSALAGGFTDLYVCRLDDGSLRRLTHDAYADIQPVWSPDGRSIAFVSDRFSTRLEDLAMGNYRLALWDLDAGEVRALPSFERAKSINPQWARGGESLYFLSDRNGATNIYRLELASRALFQVTDLLTGVSGIAELSPALSSATAADRLAVSVYQEGRYDIYSLHEPAVLRGTPVALEEAYEAALIPGGKPHGAVVAEHADADRGLADTHTFVRAPYRPKLSLDYVGQPALVAGADRFGTFVGGGASMAFSDMLGNHTLETALQISNAAGFNDIGGLVAYVNRSRRFNWGAALEQVPYVAGGFGLRTAIVGGRRVLAEDTLVDRQIERRASLLGFYPFSRSSRLELSGALRNVSFDRRIRTEFFDPLNGSFLGRSEERLSAPDALNLGEFGVAYVRDSSLFGATSPIQGQRLRLEVSPVVGSLRYTGLLADVRHYVMPVRPVTLAARILHYGRYGAGGEDFRFTPLFVGYANLVRGYDVGSFSAAECGDDPRVCPVFDQLLGSRLLVANAEWRFPLAALFGARNLYGPLPIEVGMFFDAGVAWSRGEKPKLLGGERELVRSYGATARVNLFGFAIFQVDYAKPLDRPGKRAFWQFNLIPGF